MFGFWNGKASPGRRSIVGCVVVLALGAGGNPAEAEKGSSPSEIELNYGEGASALHGKIGCRNAPALLQKGEKTYRLALGDPPWQCMEGERIICFRPWEGNRTLYIELPATTTLRTLMEIASELIRCSVERHAPCHEPLASLCD
jgi:hypothetical protein